MSKNICPNCSQVVLTIKYEQEIKCPMCESHFEENSNNINETKDYYCSSETLE